MSVYVDDMRAPFRRFVMCHMLADTTEELLAMADRLGLARWWIQDSGEPTEHFDVSLTKRAAAIRAGALEITSRDVAALILSKRATLGSSPRERTWEEGGRCDPRGGAARNRALDGRSP